MGLDHKNIEEKVMNFYTSDQHFYHKNIIRYCDRPFQGIKDMHETMVKSWNKVVTPEDTVYCLGDFAMVGTNGSGQVRKVLSKLNGAKVLILGNHDEMKPFTYIDSGFLSVHTSLEMVDQGHEIVMHHDPCIKCGIPNNKVFLHGHIHNLYKSIPEKNAVCVSVENWDYAPITMKQILKELGK